MRRTPTGEFKCSICRKWTPEDDMHFWKSKPVCFKCKQAKEENTELKVDQVLLEEGGIDEYLNDEKAVD